MLLLFHFRKESKIEITLQLKLVFILILYHYWTGFYYLHCHYRKEVVFQNIYGLYYNFTLIIAGTYFNLIYLIVNLIYLKGTYNTKKKLY